LELRQGPSFCQQWGILDNKRCLIQQCCLNEEDAKGIENNDFYAVRKILALKNENDVF
jgi:hypothetical protein